MDIRVVELGATRNTARTLDKLAENSDDDLSECGAKLGQSSTCGIWQLVQEVNLQDAIV